MHVLLLEFGEWLASVQTDKFARSSLLLLLLHRLAEQAIALPIVILDILISFCCSCLFFSLVICFVICFSILVEVF